MTTKPSKSIFDLFETDPKREVDGIWHQFGEYGSMLIARAGGANVKYLALLEERSRPYRRAIETGTLDTKVFRDVLMSVFAETIVRDWDFIDRDGTDIPCIPANVLATFKQAPELFEDVSRQANAWASYRARGVETDAKN